MVDYGDASFNNENEQQNIIRIRSRPLATILEENGSPKVIDYLSIDVEGSEERILPSFPFSRYCFSHDDHRTSKQRLKEILRLHGYVLIKEIPHLDCFYVHESFIGDYQNNVFEP